MTMRRLTVSVMLRCFQHLSLGTWLPGLALSDNPSTSGAGSSFLSY
jgi:hypothetical protein